MFIRLLYGEFADNQTNVMIEDQANSKLSILLQKKDEDFYRYYYWTETLLIEIAGKD